MFQMVVADVFYIQRRGLVATGRVESGELRAGEQVRINDGPAVRVDGIEAHRKMVDVVQVGDNVGLLFKSLTKDDIAVGDSVKATGYFLA
jgi:translation elongation factor EF-Tu-like GTPase